jgi:hypothetical protein
MRTFRRCPGNSRRRRHVGAARRETVLGEPPSGTGGSDGGAGYGFSRRKLRMPSAIHRATMSGPPIRSWRSAALVRKPASMIAWGTPGATAWQKRRELNA